MSTQVIYPILITAEMEESVHQELQACIADIRDVTADLQAMGDERQAASQRQVEQIRGWANSVDKVRATLAGQCTLVDVW